jgi:hypothetical protein
VAPVGGGSSSSGAAESVGGASQSSSPDDRGNAVELATGTAALGLSDNLLLTAMVAVFALLVIVLVSAGGHRGGWRQH